ncbi:alkaline phosphatase PhoX [Bremerella sp. T1]|uniref:alkaline phosphatase PhoX n=1 Tax=Bremerella sp. TYQ1 TaxID=3119568 RepID=UPI001CCE2672|nr:alkaline phosphatase PhoX [Bremerella volcania]UBM38319.1 PhoX family protein [Bremerella volcania]
MAETKSRREFLSDTFSVAGAFAVGSALSTFGERTALGEMAKQSLPLIPVRDEATGLPLLRLPEGFRYMSYGWTGDEMADGQPTPPAHDGMGVVGKKGNQLLLTRNHEMSTIGPAFHFKEGSPFDPSATGGCTQVVFDTRREQFVSSYGAISGTVRNCAGGVTPWASWLTCEETLNGPEDGNDLARYEKNHGWVFEVPADGTATAEPIKDMGRFVHEAVAVDRKTGYVYLTEDQSHAGFYRFRPHQPGKLAAGGILEIAEVVGQEDLQGGFPDGSTFPVRWHRIANPALERTSPDSKVESVFDQGKKLGGSTFTRLEGCWYGNDLIYFDATDGGAAKAGQIWQFDPQKQTVTLLYESRSKRILNMPDNLCVSPLGGLILCEDNDYAGEDPLPQRMLALTKDGRLSNFAENNIVLNGEHNGIKGSYVDKEWAGSTFSPDGKWLFANIQTPGVTFAITGPWDDFLV